MYRYPDLDKPSAVRTRFNAAHEIGHLVLHRRINQTKLAKAEDFKEIERQANLFAGAFLLPAETFAAELPTASLNGFLSLKERWKVSIGAMIHRCVALQLVEDEYAVRLWKHYSSRGWRTREPLDERLEIERPRLLGRSIMVLAEGGGWTVPQILAELPFAPHDIERLVSLSSGYLTGHLAKVLLMPKLRTTLPAPTVDAEILSFPERHRKDAP